MEDMQIKLSVLWVALMLSYLLGDVLRVFSGDFIPGEIEGVKVTQGLYLGLAIFMMIPIVMVFLSLTLTHCRAAWSNVPVDPKKKRDALAPHVCSQGGGAN